MENVTEGKTKKKRPRAMQEATKKKATKNKKKKDGMMT